SVSELERVERIRSLVWAARRNSVAVEAEVSALHGVGGGLQSSEVNRTELTDLESAKTFIEDTGVDALAVNVGQVHLHGRRKVRLDLDLLKRLADALPVPL